MLTDSPNGKDKSLTTSYGAQHNDTSKERDDSIALNLESNADLQEDLKQYEQLVRYCADNKIELPISNGDMEHAAIIFKVFFLVAKEEVVIYTGELYEGIFDAKEYLINSAVEFLDRRDNAKIKIAYEHSVPKDTILNRKFIKTITANAKLRKQIEIWDVSKCEKKAHFSVMDSSAYRCETNNQTRTAIADFGKETTAKAFYNDFIRITRDPNSTKIYPQNESAELSLAGGLV